MRLTAILSLGSLAGGWARVRFDHEFSGCCYGKLLDDPGQLLAQIDLTGGIVAFEPVVLTVL